MADIAPAHLIADQRYLRSFDGLRGMASLTILLFHSKRYFPWWDNHPGTPYLMVDLFFMLSGFVLARTYAQNIASGAVSFRQFAIRRLARLYPMHVVTLFSILIITIVMRLLGISTVIPHNPAPVFTFILHLLLLQNVGLVSKLSWNDPSWSISVEWVVNLLFFYVVMRWKRIPVSLLVAAIFMAVSIITLTSYTLDKSTFAGGFNLNYHNFYFINYGLLRGIASFSAGLLLYRYHLLLPRLTSPWWHMAEMAVALVVVIYVGGVVTKLPPDLDGVIVLLFFPLLLTVCLYRDSWVQKTLALRPFRVLGQLSYALYLVHIPLLVLSIATLEKIMPLPVVALFYYPAVFLVSYFCHVRVENPARDYLNQRYSHLGRGNHDGA